MTNIRRSEGPERHDTFGNPQSQKNAKRQCAVPEFTHIHDEGKQHRGRQRSEGPETESTQSAFTSREVAEPDHIACHDPGAPKHESRDAKVPEGRREQQEQESAERHQHRRKRDQFVQAVIDQDRANQQQREESGGEASRRHAQQSEDQPENPQHPNLSRRDDSTGDGSFLSMLTIELRVERVVQVHPADIEQRGPRHERQQQGKTPRPRQPPAGETVRPNGWEV